MRYVLAAAAFFALTAGVSSAQHQTVDVWLSGESGAYQAEFSFPGGEQPIAPANVDLSKIHLVILDDRDKIVLGPTNFHAGRAVLLPANARGRDVRVAVAFSPGKAPLSPGMYAATIRTDVGAFERDGSALSANAANLWRFYINRPPEKAPALVLGQRFLDAGPDPKPGATVDATPVDAPLADRNGQALSRAQIGLRPLTLTRIDKKASPHTLTFAIDGLGLASLRSDANAAHLPGLVPLVVDADVAELERSYAGRAVWTVGNRTFDCIGPSSGTASLGFDSNAQYTIEHIFRAAGLETYFNRIGATGGFDSPTGFWDANPIVVTLARAPGMHAYGGSGAAGIDGAACVGFAARFADSWDFERAFSLKSMTSAHPNWSTAQLDHIGKREVRVGMTHEMIAWMFGYPPIYGSAATLDRLATWPYQEPAPYNFCVYFHGDGVARFDPPRPMP